jgi:hypothetical protein
MHPWSGKAIGYGKWYQDARGVEGWWEGTHGPITNSFLVVPGDSARKVLETLGHPSDVFEHYPAAAVCS